jgi:hypothetical protein
MINSIVIVIFFLFMALSILLFSGDKTSFPAWRAAVLNVASASSTICSSGHGLIGFCLPPAEWATLLPPPEFPDPVDFAPVSHPGIPPSTAAAFPLWKHNHDRHSQQQSEVKAFKDKLLAALDPVTKSTISEPISSVRNRPLV